MHEPLLRPATQLAEDWMVAVFLLSLGTIAWSRAFAPVRIQRILQTPFNIRLMRQVMREEPNTPVEYLFFSFSFYALVALLIYLALKLSGITPFGWGGFGLYAALFGAVATAFLVKRIGVYAFRFLADMDAGLTEYLYSVSLLNRLAGQLVLPAAVAASYMDRTQAIVPLWIGFGILLAAFLYRILRGARNSLLAGLSPFYIFFYICTLEILPLAMCYRALSP